jgi:hypothetical protein
MLVCSFTCSQADALINARMHGRTALRSENAAQTERMLAITYGHHTCHTHTWKWNTMRASQIML